MTETQWRLLDVHQTSSVAEYAKDFLNLVIQLSPNCMDEELMPYFFKGLDERIKEELCVRDRPVSLQQYIVLAMSLEASRSDHVFQNIK